MYFALKSIGKDHEEKINNLPSLSDKWQLIDRIAKNVTYSLQYLHASINISAMSSLLCLPLFLCFAAYASSNISIIVCIVFWKIRTA